MSDELPIVLRPMTEGDRLYVKNSFVKSFGDSPWGQSMAKGVYRAGHSKVADKWIDSASVLIACPEDDPSTILGWACTDRDVVHYVYVRSKLRKQGIASMLLAPYLDKHRAVEYTHPCSWMPIPDNWTWNPYRGFLG
jgi:GNAT superfamily N-acetyltransferase